MAKYGEEKKEYYGRWFDECENHLNYLLDCEI